VLSYTYICSFYVVFAFSLSSSSAFTLPSLDHSGGHRCTGNPPKRAGVMQEVNQYLKWRLSAVVLQNKAAQHLKMKALS